MRETPQGLICGALLGCVLQFKAGQWVPGSILVRQRWRNCGRGTEGKHFGISLQTSHKPYPADREKLELLHAVQSSCTDENTAPISSFFQHSMKLPGHNGGFKGTQM